MQTVLCATQRGVYVDCEQLLEFWFDGLKTEASSCQLVYRPLLLTQLDTKHVFLLSDC